ncbi:MAG: DUF4202 family protein [Candidatus Moranbacteria bacterium]|nr:DUF4202 family protein [Candidatus Moranbacteria bacterium]
MKQDLIKTTEQFVTQAFKKANNPVEIFHATQTSHWIQKLKPEASEALQIAGLLHDIERAFYGDWKAGSSDENKLKKHQELSAKVTEDFLKQENADQSMISEVKDLILNHEEGGAGDKAVLCDADCLAYFEEKAIRNAKKFKEEGKEEKMKKKLDYVFNRISSKKAKAIAQEWYNKAIKILER